MLHCWKQTYGNSAGKPLLYCNENEDKNGLLCYPKCMSGYQGVGPVCWSICPSGYLDTGAFCSPKGSKFKIFKKLYYLNYLFNFLGSFIFQNNLRLGFFS